jgi:hypothetical protein
MMSASASPPPPPASASSPHLASAASCRSHHPQPSPPSLAIAALQHRRHCHRSLGRPTRRDQYRNKKSDLTGEAIVKDLLYSAHNSQHITRPNLHDPTNKRGSLFPNPQLNTSPSSTDLPLRLPCDLRRAVRRSHGGVPPQRPAPGPRGRRKLPPPPIAPPSPPSTSSPLTSSPSPSVSIRPASETATLAGGLSSLLSSQVADSSIRWLVAGWV